MRPITAARAAGDSGDPELDAMGYDGDAKVYRARCGRIRALAVMGLGPLAKLDRWIATLKPAPTVPRARQGG